MRLRIALVRHPDAALPFTLAISDDALEDEWGNKVPDFYTEALDSTRKNDDVEIREIFVHVPDKVIRELFETATIAPTAYGPADMET